MGHLTLGELVDWLASKDPDMVVKDGLGEPHSDRGDYCGLSFEPVYETTIGDMLDNARFAIGKVFEGWKGGDFKMDEGSYVFIGEYGECGEPITKMHFKYWELCANLSSPGEKA